MIVTLETLFPRLSDDGLYFIEDICASRFEGFHRGEKPFSDFLDYVSSIAEQLTFFADFRSGIYHSIRDTRELSKAGVEPPPRTLWNERLAAVHLFHNLCVLTKGARDFPYDPSRTVEGVGSDPYIPAREGQRFRLAMIEAEMDRVRSELSATRDALAKWAAEACRLSTELAAAVETLTDRGAEAVRILTEHSGPNEAPTKREAGPVLNRRQLRNIRTSSSSLAHRHVKVDTAPCGFGTRIAKLSLIALSLVLKPVRKGLRKMRICFRRFGNRLNESDH
jgi:hypothetical protein